MPCPIHIGKNECKYYLTPNCGKTPCTKTIMLGTVRVKQAKRYVKTDKPHKRASKYSVLSRGGL